MVQVWTTEKKLYRSHLRHRRLQQNSWDQQIDVLCVRPFYTWHLGIGEWVYSGVVAGWAICQLRYFSCLNMM